MKILMFMMMMMMMMMMMLNSSLCYPINTTTRVTSTEVKKNNDGIDHTSSRCYYCTHSSLKILMLFCVYNFFNSLLKIYLSEKVYQIQIQKAFVYKEIYDLTSKPLSLLESILWYMFFDKRHWSFDYSWHLL